MYNKQKEQPYSQPYELEGKSKILVLHHPKMTHSGCQLQHLKTENITQIFLQVLLLDPTSTRCQQFENARYGQVH